MKVCAITMVYHDYWALAQWIRHYSKHVGIENLYVVVHGPDSKVNEIAHGANIWTIPRDTLEMFDRRRNKMLNEFQAGLLQFYDWVIRTDADELICVDPGLHGTLHNMLATVADDAVFAVGLNLYESADDDIIPSSGSVFKHRTAAFVTGNYSKAWAVKNDTPLMRHGVKLKSESGSAFTYHFPLGVFLVHLKFANIAVLKDVNKTRKSVARAGVSGVPGWGWKRADAHAMAFFEKAETMPMTAWADAIKLAYDKIPTDMKYDEADTVIRSPGIPYVANTKLPDWFRTY